MGDHLQEVARIMERVAGEELGYCPLEEKKRKSLVQALKSEGIIARDLCYVEKDGSSSGTEAGISMTLSTEKRHYKAAQVADMLTVLLGKSCRSLQEALILWSRSRIVFCSQRNRNT